MREPKESPWKFYEPKSFRSWLKGNMRPVGYDKALKTKEKLAIGYFFVSLYLLNRVLWNVFSSKDQAPTVGTEHPLVDSYNVVTPVEEDKEVYLFSFDKFKFKSVEVVDRKELQKRRLLESENPIV